MAAAQSSEHEV